MSIKSIETEISATEAKLFNLKAKLDAAKIAANSPEKNLADVLHSKFCRWNHTDGCGWFYEQNSDKSWKWDGYAHTEYLKKAQVMLAECKLAGITPDQAIAFVTIVR